jgi:hypothetical protein
MIGTDCGRATTAAIDCDADDNPVARQVVGRTEAPPAIIHPAQAIRCRIGCGVPIVIHPLPRRLPGLPDHQLALHDRLDEVGPGDRRKKAARLLPPLPDRRLVERQATRQPPAGGGLGSQHVLDQARKLARLVQARKGCCRHRLVLAAAAAAMPALCTLRRPAEPTERPAAAVRATSRPGSILGGSQAAVREAPPPPVVRPPPHIAPQRANPAPAKADLRHPASAARLATARRCTSDLARRLTTNRISGHADPLETFGVGTLSRPGFTGSPRPQPDRWRIRSNRTSPPCSTPRSIGESP